MLVKRLYIQEIMPPLDRPERPIQKVLPLLHLPKTDMNRLKIIGSLCLLLIGVGIAQLTRYRVQSLFIGGIIECASGVIIFLGFRHIIIQRYQDFIKRKNEGYAQIFKAENERFIRKCEEQNTFLKQEIPIFPEIRRFFYENDIRIEDLNSEKAKVLRGIIRSLPEHVKVALYEEVAESDTFNHALGAFFFNIEESTACRSYAGGVNDRINQATIKMYCRWGSIGWLERMGYKREVILEHFAKEHLAKNNFDSVAFRLLKEFLSTKKGILALYAWNQQALLEKMFDKGLITQEAIDEVLREECAAFLKEHPDENDYLFKSKIEGFTQHKFAIFLQLVQKGDNPKLKKWLFLKIATIRGYDNRNYTTKPLDEVRERMNFIIHALESLTLTSIEIRDALSNIYGRPELLREFDTRVKEAPQAPWVLIASSLGTMRDGAPQLTPHDAMALLKGASSRYAQQWLMDQVIANPETSWAKAVMLGYQLDEGIALLIETDHVQMLHDSMQKGTLEKERFLKILFSSHNWRRFKDSCLFHDKTRDFWVEMYAQVPHVIADEIQKREYNFLHRLGPAIKNYDMCAEVIKKNIREYGFKILKALNLLPHQEILTRLTRQEIGSLRKELIASMKMRNLYDASTNGWILIVHDLISGHENPLEILSLIDGGTLKNGFAYHVVSKLPQDQRMSIVNRIYRGAVQNRHEQLVVVALTHLYLSFKGVVVRDLSPAQAEMLNNLLPGVTWEPDEMLTPALLLIKLQSKDLPLMQQVYRNFTGTVDWESMHLELETRFGLEWTLRWVAEEAPYTYPSEHGFKQVYLRNHLKEIVTTHREPSSHELDTLSLTPEPVALFLEEVKIGNPEVLAKQETWSKEIAIPLEIYKRMNDRNKESFKNCLAGDKALPKIMPPRNPQFLKFLECLGL